MVTSTVHLTGSPTDEIKEAMSKLLSRSTDRFCTKKENSLGDAEVRQANASCSSVCFLCTLRDISDERQGCDRVGWGQEEKMRRVGQGGWGEGREVEPDFRRGTRGRGDEGIFCIDVAPVLWGRLSLGVAGSSDDFHAHPCFDTAIAFRVACSLLLRTRTNFSVYCKFCGTSIASRCGRRVMRFCSPVSV